MYLGLDAIVIAYFTSDFFWAFTGVTIDPKWAMLVHLSGGGGLFLTLLLIKRVSIKTTGVIQAVTTVLKFLPLIFGVFVGLIVRAIDTGGVHNAFVDGPWVKDSG